MSTQTLKFLIGGNNGKIRVKTTTRTVGGLEVLVRITHSGLCGTDGHDRTAGCGLGHEGVGIVEEVGSQVTAVGVGDRVGCSWQTGSCGHCRECISGYRQCCPRSTGQKYSDPDEEGTFSNYVIRHQDFVYLIPAEIESRHAGPLICAGITVFEALQVAETKSTDRVGVVGLGGVGHLAVMYARAMGCDVTVFSGRADKKADALKLGATDFRVWRAGAEAGAGAKVTDANVDVMILCGGSISNLDGLMTLLGRRARIVPLAIQAEPLVIPYMPFILGGHRIIGSTSAKRENHAAALALAARHHIRPWIEEFPMTAEGLTAALDKLRDGTVIYRAVLSKELGDGLI